VQRSGLRRSERRATNNDIKRSKARGENRFMWWTQFSVKSDKPTKQLLANLLEVCGTGEDEMNYEL
jgi:hypothetical protein